MLAYCTALGVSHGHLVYARGNQRPAHYTVRNSAVEIICHVLDLGQSPSALLVQVGRVAQALVTTSVWGATSG
jgi:5-methylcytosine-specific restriction enzyme subunit McrC